MRFTTIQASHLVASQITRMQLQFRRRLVRAHICNLVVQQPDSQLVSDLVRNSVGELTKSRIRHNPHPLPVPRNTWRRGQTCYPLEP